MKYRAITTGLVGERPLQFFSDSMEAINTWAHIVAEKHKINVKIFETYERVLGIVKKPYIKEEREPGCYCGIRVYCKLHPQKGFQEEKKL